LSRSTLDSEFRAQLRTLLSQDVDWEEMIRAAVVHGVLPMVWQHLSALEEGTVPGSVLNEMRTCYLALFRTGLQVRGECARILNDLADAGVPALAFKGPVVAAMAYDDPNLRTCTDLDVFIRKSDVPQALDALRAMRFEARNPLQADYDDQWSTYLPYHRPHGNANGYVRDQGTPGELRLDLHWGFASRYFLCAWDPVGVCDRSQTIEVGGADVPTFSDEDTLVFLCLHATKDNFDRLRLVCDIAEFLRTHPALDVGAAFATAQDAGCARMLVLGVTLAHVLLDAPLPPSLRTRTAAPSMARLVRRATGLLFHARHGVSGIVQRSRFHLQVRDRMQDAVGTIFYQIELSFRTMLGRLSITGPPARSRRSLNDL